MPMRRHSGRNAKHASCYPPCESFPLRMPKIETQPTCFWTWKLLTSLNLFRSVKQGLTAKSRSLSTGNAARCASFNIETSFGSTVTQKRMVHYNILRKTIKPDTHRSVALCIAAMLQCPVVY